ncbi:MAG TPA: hypothetical protein VE129_04230 [Thermoanaerobaculia bacterium]|nr:hypothetical protein [Thermoanaerobaculia bacterium]
MKRSDEMLFAGFAAAAIAAAVAVAALAVTPPLAAQEMFRIVVDSVAESRSREASNETAGRLTLMPRLEGEGLADAKAFRIRVTAARDDTGHDLLPEEPATAPWEENPAGEGLWIHLGSSARGAGAVTVAGMVELWMPKRDATRASPTKKSVVTVPFELKDVPLP